MRTQTVWRLTAFIGLVSAPLCLDAASVSLLGVDQIVSANGASVTGEGQIVGAASFSSSITHTNNGPDDSALLEVRGNGLRVWISDESDDQVDWTTDFSFVFSEPVDNLKLMPDSPGNNSDTVLWTVSWEASSDVASIRNSPDLVNEYSLYLGAGRIADGDFVSGTTFRMDDDNLFSGDANGTSGGDLNIAIPTDPWVIDLPRGVTSIDIRASVPDSTTDNRAFEGFGVDFSAVTVPEPNFANGPLLLLLLTLGLRVYRGKMVR